MALTAFLLRRLAGQVLAQAMRSRTRAAQEAAARREREEREAGQEAAAEREAAGARRRPRRSGRAHLGGVAS